MVMEDNKSHDRLSEIWGAWNAGSSPRLGAEGPRSKDIKDVIVRPRPKA